VVFVISDETVDRHDTRFKLDGWDLTYAQRNPVVTYGHPDLSSTDDTLYIGRSEVYKEGNKLKAKVTFNPDNPRAVRVEKAVRNGFLNMASIRAEILDYDLVKYQDREILEFRQQRLFDFGIVPHGSNQSSFAEKRDIMIRSLQKVEEVTDQEETAKIIEIRALTKHARNILQKIKKHG
jgi:hypothetical protein